MKFLKEVPENITPKEFMDLKREHHDMIMRVLTTGFLLFSYTILLLFTMTIIFFQGFNYRGFKLEPTFLNWLGGATIGEIGGLACLVYGFFFKRPKNF